MFTWMPRNTSFLRAPFNGCCCGPPFSSNRLLVLPPLTLTLLHLCRGTSVTLSLRSPSRNEPPLTRRALRTALAGATGTSSCPKRCSDIARGDFMQVIVVGASVFAEETDFTSRSLPSFFQDESFLPRDRVFGAEIGFWDELGRSPGKVSVSLITWTFSLITWTLCCLARVTDVVAVQQESSLKPRSRSSAALG